MSAMKTKVSKKAAPTPPPRTWFVYTDSSRGNEVLARFFGGEAESLERARHGVLCADGRRRDLWSITVQEATPIKSAATEYAFLVTFFYSVGGEPPRRFIPRSNYLRRRGRGPVVVTLVKGKKTPE